MKLNQVAEGIAKNRGRTERIIHKYFMQKGGRFRDGTFYYPRGEFLITSRDGYDENPSNETIETIQHFVNGNDDEVYMMHFVGGDKQPASDEITLDVWQKVRNP